MDLQNRDCGENVSTLFTSRHKLQARGRQINKTRRRGHLMVNNSVRCLLPETRSALSKDKESALWILQVRLPRTEPPLTRTTPLQPLIFPFWVGAGRKRNGIQSKPTFNSAGLGTLCVKLQRKGAHHPVRGMRELRLKRNELKLDQETKREILC